MRASAAAVDQLQSVLQLSVEQLQSVLQLSPERLVAASAALAQLAQLPATAADESPAQPQRLPFTDQLEGTGAGSDEVELFSAAINALNCDEDGSRSGAGSVGSLCGDLADFHPGESEASDGDRTCRTCRSPSGCLSVLVNTIELLDELAKVRTT